MKRIAGLCILIFLNSNLSCNKTEGVDIAEESENYLFQHKNPSETGVHFSNQLVNSPDLNILNYIYYYNGAGVGIADFNNDNLPDIYFGSNQGADKLYLNIGNLQFEDITTSSGIDNSSGWTNGISIVDINNDGLIDIYISKVGKHLGIYGHNLLYVNQGINNGIPKFIEKSEEYGLAISSYGTQSAFFDYDLDGDLDLYLMNHSVHPNSNYGKGQLRMEIDSLSGDMLLENRNGKYIDVSQEAGIFQGKIGYGLGLSISDINQDGYPDIYVGNDFFENDYLYINQGDKTFKEIISTDPNILGHTTHYSMGNSVTDLNNDGRPDIVSLDMLPENLESYKTSALEYSYPVYNSYLRNGYHPQYMQNTLHLNFGDLRFKEVAHLSGIAASEWSWSPLAVDFDNDGFRDLFVSNGILGATNDMDFINFISNDEIQSKLGDKISPEHMQLINKLPSKKVENYMFKNLGNNKFQNMNGKWMKSTPSYSHGAAYSDLDNDGDLDLVVNNVNEPAYILENLSDTINTPNNFLKIKFEGSQNNKHGIGAKVKAYTEEREITSENYTTQGFLSSIEPSVHIGLGTSPEIDSLLVIWPSGKYEVKKDIATNQTLVLREQEASGNFYLKANNDKSNIPGIHLDFVHDERTSIEFNRDPLIPYASTNEGPSISVADVNKDGREDFFISGAKSQASALFLQNLNGTFTKSQEELFAKATLNEDTSHDFADFNQDGWLDLIVVSGGNEFPNGKALVPRIYFSNSGKFIEEIYEIKDIEVNASKVVATDLNLDNYPDLIISSDSKDLVFGKTPEQHILINDTKGGFNDVTSTLAPDFQNIGNVKDFSITDLDNDGDLDLVVVGHWMPISIFLNEKGAFRKASMGSLQKSNGWWNTVEVGDFDQDGDIDIVAGNWGLNSRLKASGDEPITLYSYDFDNNGKVEPLVTFFFQGVETPFASKEDIVKQLPNINKKYLSFSKFAKASLEEIFGKEDLNKANKKYVYELATCYFENDGNLNFTKQVLPWNAQVSSVFDIVSFRIDKDPFLDLFLTGNNFEISTQLSRLDASHGEILLFDEKKGFVITQNDKYPISGAVRSLEPIKINQEKYLIVGRNNDSPLFLKIEEYDDEKEDL